MIPSYSGAAAHGDYVFGWEGNTLQKAMDSGCNLNRDCPAAGITAQPADKYNACTKQQQAKEPVDGCKSAPNPPRDPICPTIYADCCSVTGLPALPMGGMMAKR